MRARIELPGLLALALILLGCAGETFAPDAAPEYLVIHDLTPLYHYGPQQGGAPEAHLRKDERLRMLRREFGYSFMQMNDGQTGYVANEELEPAPPLPKPPVQTSDDRESASLPPIEPPLPKPDLEAPPADAPTDAR